MLRIVAATALLLLACVSAASAGPIQTGVYLGATDPHELAQIAAAGATVERIGVRWAAVAPSQPAPGTATYPNNAAYDWTQVDAAVEAATAHHLTPLLTVYDAPAWAERRPGPVGSGGSRVRIDALSAFSTAIASRYDGYHSEPRVRYWQIWNEPNVNLYLSPQFSAGAAVSPAVYRTMVNKFAGAVHAVDSSNVVVAGGLSPFTVTHGSTMAIGPLSFMRQMLCMSSGAQPHPTCSNAVHFDVWAHNPYTSGDAFHHATNPNDVSLGDLPKMHTLLMAAYKAHHILTPHTPGFWVTEFSWDSNPPDPCAVPILLHARWVAEALYQMWQSGVTLTIWLQLRDAPYPASSFQSGLYFVNGKPKPALTAFRFPFVAYLRTGGVYVWGRTPWGKSGAVLVQERRPGTGWRTVSRLATDRFGVFSTTVNAPATASDFFRASLAGGSQTSLSFSLRQPPDRIVDAFGCGG